MKKKQLNYLVKKLCSKESGKQQIGAGQAREILAKLVELFIVDNKFSDTFYCYLLETIDYKLKNKNKEKKKKGSKK